MRPAGALVGLLALAAACGGKSPTAASAVVSTTTITITSAGASPKNIQIAIGARVLFINNDTRSHNMTSDPHPEHDICPDINQVGFLLPGQSRETGNLVVVRTCGFHDHDDPDTKSLQGSITIK